MGKPDSEVAQLREAREREHRVLLRTLDCLPLNLLYYDLHGERLHSNANARRLVRELFTPEQLLDGIAEFVLRLTMDPGRQPEWKTRELAVGGSRFLVRAGFVAIPLFAGDGFVLVSIAAQQSGLSADELQATHGLTRRQARIALLLAAGLSNREIADQLSISPHTVRRHTEQVMSKLNVRSRAQVATVLMHGKPTWFNRVGQPQPHS